jgi:DNA-binding MarR family transcriptional regulator
MVAYAIIVDTIIVMKTKVGFIAADSVPAGCSARKLRQLSRRVSQHFDLIVARAGLKTTQYSLLSQILALGPMRPGDLAQAMEMDASTLTRNLQPLVAQEWITVGPGRDGRSRLVSITATGREKRAQAQREWKRAQRAFNERMGTELVGRLHTVIDECLECMNEAPEKIDTL